MLSRLHMRLQPRAHAVAGTLPGAACLESLERAGQSDNFELETHWRMLILGGGAGAGTLAPHPRPAPPHGPNTLRTRLTLLGTLPTYSAYVGGTPRARRRSSWAAASWSASARAARQASLGTSASPLSRHAHMGTS